MSTNRLSGSTEKPPKQPWKMPSWVAKAWADFISAQGTKPFRRYDVARAFYPRTTPRDAQRAEQIAEHAMRDAAKRGEIQRTGHLHWVLTTQQRTLMSGRSVAIQEGLQTLQVQTHVPDKYVLVDLETGDVLQGRPLQGRPGSGWARAEDCARDEAQAILSHAPQAARANKGSANKAQAR